MEWLEVTFTAEPQWQDIISQVLLDQGVQGLEIVDPEDFRRVYEKNRCLDYADDGFIESFGNKTIIKAYFQSGRDEELLRKQLGEAISHFIPEPLPEPVIRRRDDSEWKDSWKQYYKTFSISNRVIIRPSWENILPPDGKIVIELEPGMAFGTGTHETTRMCAAFLDDLVKPGDRVLDLGCGTGILGIIAAKLGAQSVTCVDIDDAACNTARDNIRKNNAGSNVGVIQGELENAEAEAYDIIVVNIIADVILSLIPRLKYYCGKKTNILLSGIIRERRPEVVEAAEKQGYRLVQELVEGEWVALRLCTGF